MYSSYSVAAATCSIVFPVLAFVAVLLRFRARRIKSLSFGPDDYVVGIALCLAIGLCCIVFYGACVAGIGQKRSTMTPAKIKTYQKHLYYTVIVAHLAIGIVKISVLSFYKRIFTTKSFRRAANVTLAFVYAWILGAFFTQIFSAWPTSNWWKTGQIYVFNYGAFITAFAATDVVLDVTILSLPLPVIGNLHMSRKRKFSIMGIFWLGFFCIIAATVRLYFSYKLSTATDKHLTDDSYSVISVNNVIWSEIEPCASIIAACLPTFGPLFMGGISLQSRAKSIKSRLFKRSTSTSTESRQQASRGWPGSKLMPRVKGPGIPVGDGNIKASHTTDVELGERELHSDRRSLLNPMPRAKAAWEYQDNAVPRSYTGQVTVHNPTPYDIDAGGIHVQRTFASESEKR